MSPVYFGWPDLDREPIDVAKSRHACAHPGCARGPSLGFRITFVHKPGERRTGYCAEHLNEHS